MREVIFKKGKNMLMGLVDNSGEKGVEFANTLYSLKQYVLDKITEDDAKRFLNDLNT